MTPDEAEMLIRIDERQNVILEQVAKLRGAVEALTALISELQSAEASCRATQETRWAAHDREHKDLQIKQWGADVASFFVAVAGAMRAFLGP